MILPESHIQKLFDRLAQSATSFALYRLPWTDEPILVLQKEGEAEAFDDLSELNGKKGFVLAPFHRTESHPIVLIRPDIVAHEWEQIIQEVCHIFPQASDVAIQNGTDSDICMDTPEENKQHYEEAFARFIAPLQQKTFKKLVLSRHCTQPVPEEFSPLAAFVRACNSYPRMMISLCHTPQTGTWIGSTPEIILSGQEKLWHTVSLAGTMPMQGESIPTEWSTKNQEEQAFVSEYIRKCVKQFGSQVTEKGPYTARAGHVVHLKTDFHFSLKETGHLGDLLKTLHPTPAVCGLPKQPAYDFILENEHYDRSYYSGIIGWLEPEGHTTLYVNLRCMKIEDKQITFYAGGGILPSSVADSEWEETQQKMNTMRHIL